MARILNGCKITQVRGEILAYVREHEDSDHADNPRGVATSQIANHVDVQESAVRENCNHLKGNGLLDSQQGFGPHGPRPVWVISSADGSDEQDKPRKREYIG